MSLRSSYRMSCRPALLFAACVAVVAGLSAQVPDAPGGKRPLTRGDYDAWRSIAGQTLSPDGRWLAYSFMPQDGDGELVVRDLASGRERREPVGALPPPPRGIRIAFTGDSRFLVASTYPAKALTDQAKKDKKKPEDMPKGGLLMMNLESGAVTRAASVKSFQVPSQGGTWVAYLKEASPEQKSPETPQGESAKAEVPAGLSGSRSADKKEYGTDLILRNLAAHEGGGRDLPDVTEYVFAVDPASDGTPVALLQGKGKYTKLAFDREHMQLAFVSSRDDAESKNPAFKVYHWPRTAQAATELVSSVTPGFPGDLSVSEKEAPAFSRDGARVYVAAARRSEPVDDEDESSTNDKVVADLWHWQDDYVQLAGPSLPTVSLSDDGLDAIGFDDRSYRRMVDYDGTYNDVYLVDARSGSQTSIVKRLRGGFFGRSGVQWSPDGRLAAFFKERHWHLVDASTGTGRNLADTLSVSFADEEDDTPDPPMGYGSAGWTTTTASSTACGVGTTRRTSPSACSSSSTTCSRAHPGPRGWRKASRISTASLRSSGSGRRPVRGSDGRTPRC